MLLRKFFNKEVKPHRDAWVVIFCVLIFILLRLPSVVEPYWYGDEGIYQVIGKALNSGMILYKDIWDNKPPLLYFIYAIFNGDQFSVKILSIIFGSFSVIAFYFLGKRFFKKKISVVVSTLIYAVLFGSPIFEGNIANAENFMHLPIILSVILLLKSDEFKNIKIIFLSGLLLSFAVMTKAVALFEFLAFSIFLFLNSKSHIENLTRNIISFISSPRYLFYLLGFALVPLFFVVYFLLLNAFPDFIGGVFSENIDYVGEENALFFPNGILLIKTIIAIGLLLIIFIKRRDLNSKFLLIYLWMVMSLFSTFFSQRPYLHYVLMSIIPLSYFIGIIIESKVYRLVKIITLLLIVLILYFNFGIYKKTYSYYLNYFQFVLSDKPLEDYQAFFDRNTPRDYELARFIDRFGDGGKNSVFLWSDSSQIYALSDTLPPGKYIVAYHITYYNNAVPYMIEKIDMNQPKYIIKTKDSPEFRKFLPAYDLKYRIRDASIYERQN